MAENGADRIVTSEGATATIPAPLKGVVGTVLETKPQADKGRNRVIKYIGLFVGAGGFGIIVSMLSGFASINQTVTNAIDDHKTTAEHTLQIGQNSTKIDAVSIRVDGIEKTMGENQGIVLKAIDGTNNKVDRLLTSVGRLEGKIDASSGGEK